VLQGLLASLQLDLHLFVQLFRGQSESALLGRGAEGRLEGAGHLRQGDAVLRPLRAGQAGLDGAEVEFEGVGENRIGGRIGAEKPLLLAVALDQIDQLAGTAGAGEVGERLGVHWEKAHGGAVLGGHVGDQGAVGQRDLREAAAVELDELADHPLFAQYLGDSQGDVGRGGPGLEAAAEAEADHLGHEHVEGLAEHHRFGLDSADAPADDAEAVDHGGVRVGADQAVGIGDPALRRVCRENAAGEIFEVDLVDDADARGDDLEGLEGFLAPFEELVAFAVALELDLHIAGEGAGATEGVDLDRVVDDQFGRDEGFDLFGVAAHALHGRAHRRQVDDSGNAGEILHDHPCRFEGDLHFGGFGRVPAGKMGHIRFGHIEAVAVAQQGFEQHLDAEGEAGDGGVFVKGAEGVDGDRAGGGVQFLRRAEGIMCNG